MNNNKTWSVVRTTTNERSPRVQRLRPLVEVSQLFLVFVVLAAGAVIRHQQTIPFVIAEVTADTSPATTAAGKTPLLRPFASVVSSLWMRQGQRRISRWPLLATKRTTIKKRILMPNAMSPPTTTTTKRSGTKHVPIVAAVLDPWSRIGGGAVNEKPRRQGYVRSKNDDTINDREFNGKKNAPTCRTLGTTPPPSSQVINCGGGNGPATGGGFDARTHKSHLWHALEGLDRYPNYLSRWNEPDMLNLEEALQAKLKQVQEQRREITQQRQSIHQLVVQRIHHCNNNDHHQEFWHVLGTTPTTWEFVQSNILDPRLGKVIFGSKMFQNPSTIPSIKDVLLGHVQVELDVGLLEGVIEEAVYDVFAFPILRREFCSHLRAYVRALLLSENSTEQEQQQRQGTGDDDDQDLLLLPKLGLRPLDLDTIGLDWVNNLIFHLVIRPVARHLFEQSESMGELDWRQGYIAAYSAHPNSDKPRQHLVTHTDDSEVTLNIGLGKEWDGGGNVEFRGLRGTKTEGQLIDVWEPLEGTAVLHAGRHFHNVTREIGMH